jgi:hypothetical protein
LVVAATPVATAKKQKGADATARVVVSVPAAQRRTHGHGRTRGKNKASAQPHKGAAKIKNTATVQTAGAKAQKAGPTAKKGGGNARKVSAKAGGSSAAGSTATPTAVAATATAVPASRAAATRARAARRVVRTPTQVRALQPREVGAAASGGLNAAGSGLGAGFAAAAGNTAPASGSTAAGRAPARSSGRSLARETAESSPVARTAARIVNVIPSPMWVLIGVLAALTFALGANSWIGDRQRRRLREDVGLLQSALLPAVPGVLGAVATSAAYRPADGPGAGGDFYDMFELGDGRLGVVVGDLSGHGHEVLPQTALTRYTLRAYLEAGLSPRTALQTASGVLDHQLEVAFATVAVAIYDPRGRTLTYALAGHPHPIVVGPDGPVEAVTAAGSAPLGAGLSTGVRQTTLTLPGRATVCFHTDGLTEARRGGHLFGKQRLERALSRLGGAASADVLLDRVAEQCDRCPDDMAACVLTLPGAPLPLGARVEELEVDRRELDSDRPEQFLLACGLRPDAVPNALAAARDALGSADAAVLHVAAVNGSLAVDVLPPELEDLSALAHEPRNERTLS